MLKLRKGKEEKKKPLTSNHYPYIIKIYILFLSNLLFPVS